MKAFKDWISSSQSLLSVRPLSSSADFVDEEPLNEESDGQVSGSTSTTSSSVHPSPDTSTHYSIDNQVNEVPSPPQPVPVESSHLSHHIADGKKGDPLAKVEALQIKFLRLVHRLGQSPENLVVVQVLYRLRLACLIRAGESDIKTTGLKNDKARAIAAEQEASGQSDLDFSLKILLLGKTGVGKSATINSIFDQTKAATNAFQPATDQIHEVVGTICGIKVTVIDTPGLLPSYTNQRQNRKIMQSVRRFIKKSPPDVVLYFERLDVINMGYSDFPLLKLITDILGSTIWFNTILVMTHSSSALPEGPDGYPVSYEAFVTQCTNLVQHYIHQAVGDTRLENPVLLVENHPLCKTNNRGEKILPNGQVWRLQFLLLCMSTKVLGDANTLLEFHDSFQVRQNRTRLPSLPHLLSSFLRPRNTNGSEDEVDEMLDMDDEDDYDQLPPIRILKKTQFEKLTKAQKNDYLDELDYRETLFLKKQLKEELRRRREKILSKDEVSANDDNYENGESPEAVPLPDMAIPLSFDSDYPVYRYRCLLSNDRWLLRPVLDSQGWDHDVGFDGINLEISDEIRRNLHASVVGQMSKDKRDFNIQTECGAVYTDLKGPSVYAGIDIQTAGRDLVCTIRGDTKLRNLQRNVTGCGLSLTSFGGKYFIGSKIEDSVSIGKRLKFDLNVGRMGGPDQKAAYGGSIEATLKGKDYPARSDKVSLAMTVMSHDKERVFGGSLQSEFRLFRGTKMSVNVNLNSKRLGQICLRTSSSDHIEIAFIALVPIVRALFRRKTIDDDSPVNGSREDLY
ncbi:avirulence induced gene (AIG1) family protein [Tasmannia lanceolata]|uniref:avirulence induced gene (AIG1) family protein n=1 Tax=Tasmannia lanceolata TaxID=3420 RepID=UPI004063098F